MVFPICHESAFTALDAAGTNRKTEGANPDLTAGHAVRWICVESGNGAPPVHVVVHIVAEGRPVEIRAKWVRGPSDHGGAGALIWDGYFPIPKGTSFFISVRNDTGENVPMKLHWVTELLRPELRA